MTSEPLRIQYWYNDANGFGRVSVYHEGGHVINMYDWPITYKAWQSMVNTKNWFKLCSIEWLAIQKRVLRERLELSTSAWLSRDKHGEGTVYKYGALTDCATGAPV